MLEFLQKAGEVATILTLMEARKTNLFLIEQMEARDTLSSVEEDDLLRHYEIVEKLEAVIQYFATQEQFEKLMNT